MGQETQNKNETSQPQCHHKSWLVILISVLATAVIVGGGVYFLMNRQDKKEKKNLTTQIETENKALLKCESEKESLEKEVAGNKKNEMSDLTNINNWTLVSHDNFWNNPKLFKSGSHGFPDIKFSYPENWSFACCGDMSHASVHTIYSSKERDLALPYISITDFVLKGCPNSQKICALDKQVNFSATEKFDQIKSGIATENVLPEFKLGKLNVDAFVFKKQKKDNSYSKAYLINTGNDVVEIDFVNYDLSDDSFIEEFLNKISFE